MSTPTIQLAFQGGGAKLAAMLPIAHAFRQAEQHGFITIARVSGTSAGAICAALMATGADFEQVRKYVASQGPAHLAALIPSKLQMLIQQQKSGRAFGFWTLARNARLVRDVAIAGKPLLRNSELKRFIAGILAAGREDHPRLIEDCPVDLIITASDVINSTGILHERGDIVSAVEDSCSLPVLLRSFGSLSNSHYVDGGLCDNLPVDCLKSDSQAPIFAVFPETVEKQATNWNILSYFVSLLSASINHNVERSIAMVGPAYRFPARARFGLLDFDQAVAQLDRADWYKIAFDDAMERIEAFSKSFGFTRGRSEARVVDSVDIDQFRTTLSNLTDNKAGQKPQLRCRKGKFVVRINDDRRLGAFQHSFRREADTITRISQLEVLSDDVRFHRATVNVAEDSIIPTIWSARNLSRAADVPIAALPLNRGSFAGVPMRHCLLEFVDHQQHFSVGDTLELQSSYPSQPHADMRKLNMGQPDYFGFSNSTGMIIDEVELILVYPKSLGDFSLVPDMKRCRYLTSEPVKLDLLSMGGIPMDPAQKAIGLSVRNVGLEAALFATVVPD